MIEQYAIPTDPGLAVKLDSQVKKIYIVLTNLFAHRSVHLIFSEDSSKELEWSL